MIGSFKASDNLQPSESDYSTHTDELDSQVYYSEGCGYTKQDIQGEDYNYVNFDQNDPNNVANMGYNDGSDDIYNADNYEPNKKPLSRKERK